MQRYNKRHILLAGLILAIWAWVPLAGGVRALIAPARCHCPAHAPHAVPNGPAYAPCDDGSAVQAAGPSSPLVAARTEPDSPDALRYSLVFETIVSPEQITRTVASPPPRRAI
jgi:hypothetical protein